MSVEEGDDEVGRFLEGLHAGLAAVVYPLPDLEPQLSASSWIGYTFPTVVDELSSHGRNVAICLDDYHHVHDPNVHTVVQALVEGLPDNANLVVGSRIDPPLRLARLRASRQIEELRLADLQFSLSETGSLLRSAFGLELDHSLVTTLHERTEGCAAGISLAGVTFGSSSDTTMAVEALPATDRLIFEYLSEETLEGLDSELRDFLVTMSVAVQHGQDVHPIALPQARRTLPRRSRRAGPRALSPLSTTRARLPSGDRLEEAVRSRRAPLSPGYITGSPRVEGSTLTLPNPRMSSWTSSDCWEKVLARPDSTSTTPCT